MGIFDVDFDNLKDNKPQTIAKRAAIIVFGCIIYSVGLSIFLDCSGLVSGGFSGVAMLLSRIIPIELNTGVIVIILNVPLFIIGLKIFGRWFLFNTIFGTVLYSLLVYLFEYFLRPFLPLTENLLLIAIFGGVISGIGLATVFRSGATTGGTDVVVRLMRLKLGDMSFGTMFLLLDFTILLVQAIVFKNIELTLYSALAIAIEDITFDRMLYGFDEAKLFYIISADAESIKRDVIDKLSLGVTVLKGTGGYSGEEKEVLMVAIKKHNYAKLKAAVRDHDPDAFFIVCSSNEIFGKGFKNNDKKDL